MSEDEAEYGLQPPQDNGAEQCVLGGMLLSGDAIADCTALLKPEDFYRPGHTLIFKAITNLVTAGDPVDAVTVGNKLKVNGELQRIGGLPYLHTLLETVPVAANAVHYAKIVASKAGLRRLGQLGQRLQQLAYSDTTDESDIALVLGEGEALFRAQHHGSGKSLMWDELVAHWKGDQEVPTAAIRTPWGQLNDWLNGGIRGGELMVVAARPSVGKSNLGLNITQYAAECGHPSTAFSVEMGRLSVVNRMLANGAHVKMKQLIRRDLDLEEDNRISEYISSSAGMQFECVDQENITVEQIVAHLRSKRVPPQVCFVDYAQLLQATDKRVDRQLQVAHISRSLKIAARELDCAMIVAAQLNRGPVKDGKPRAPIASDIAESDKLQHDADVVVLLDRQDGEQSVIQFIVAKNRNGRKGSMELPFYGAEARIG